MLARLIVVFVLQKRTSQGEQKYLFPSLFCGKDRSFWTASEKKGKVKRAKEKRQAWVTEGSLAFRLHKTAASFLLVCLFSYWDLLSSAQAFALSLSFSLSPLYLYLSTNFSLFSFFLWKDLSMFLSFYSLNFTICSAHFSLLLCSIECKKNYSVLFRWNFPVVFFYSLSLHLFCFSLPFAISFFLFHWFLFVSLAHHLSLSLTPSLSLLVSQQFMLYFLSLHSLHVFI